MNFQVSVTCGGFHICASKFFNLNLVHHLKEVLVQGLL